MTITLPENLERSIRAEVDLGHFASVEDAVTQAVQLLLQKGRGGAVPDGPSEGEAASHSHKPIWEVFEEISASIPEEEWAKLPTDGAEQHDHYIHGTPKRPPS
jgi:Arc/MetJ-type ribon-helix-helix transcriptional regulator